MGLPRILLGLCCGGLIAVSVRADEPLHVRIDTLIAERASGEFSPLSDDAEFLRRVYLDLAGRIPTVEEVRSFLADGSADKRERCIDALLASDDYPVHMATTFDIMLMERRGEHAEWTKFLQQSFTQNKPWDRFVREIVTPDAENKQTRGAAFFYTRRLERYGQQPDDMPGLVRDVGRMFLGMDVQCAQCHDHLFIDDYKQVDYQGLFAFVGQTFIRQDKKFPAVAEKPLMQELEFASVFVEGQKTTGPRIPGRESIAVPTFEKGQEYLEPPDNKTKSPGKLKFSPLQLLAEELPRADNPAFARNIVNRLWWLMHGRGLVEPLDQHHADNPPTHPELLDLLATEFVSHQFDIKWLLRELALSQTYQRSSLRTDANRHIPAPGYLVAAEKRLSAEQLLDSVLVATGERERVLDGGKLTDEKLPAKYLALRTRFRAAIALPEKEPEIEIVPSVKGALFFSNDSELIELLSARSDNLIDRVQKLETTEAIADELFLSTLTRYPTAEERTELAELLDQQDLDRKEILRIIAWALISSNEFFINH